MLQFGDKRPSMENIDDALEWKSNRGSKRAPGQVKHHLNNAVTLGLQPQPALLSRSTGWKLVSSSDLWHLLTRPIVLGQSQLTD